MILSKNLVLHDQLRKLRIVPVVSLPSVQAGLHLAEILLRFNLPVIEITFRTSCAVEAMRALKNEYPELLLLAGTVLSSQQVDDAVMAGAAAIVSPGFSFKLAAYCKEKAIPFLPGVCTPSEVQMAVEAGFSFLKYFPAEIAGGIRLLSLFYGVYKNVSFMPTGGITQTNIADYLGLENVLCCGGTWLSPEQLLIDERWDEIESRVETVMQVISK